MQKKGLDVVLLRQNADLFYFTGTVQDAHFLIPSHGDAHYLVWRSYERALNESPLGEMGWVRPLRGLSHFVTIVQELGLDKAKNVGLEMDVLPAGLFLFYKDQLWPEANITDVSPLVRGLRSIKDGQEIENIKGAAERVYQVLEKAPQILKPGLTELDFAAQLECELRKRGHCGLLRMRIWNQEMGMDQVVSGSSASAPSWTNTPVGGRGPHPAFGMGASFKEIKEGEVVSVDIGGWYQGYCCDTTRPFFIGTPPSQVVDAFHVVKELMGGLEERLTVGAVCGEIYQYAVDFMERAGFKDNFMGIKGQQVSFVGHGLGVELDEYPFVSKGNKMVLQQGMVVALEPKVILSEYGVVGLEDTYLVTETKCQRLTLGEQRLTIL